MTDTDYDTTERVERTDRGYRLSIESTRGTGTRDQDKVKAELRTETPAGPTERAELLEHVTMAMEQRRNHNPDESGD